MKTIDKKIKRIMYPLFFIILSGIIIFNIVRIFNNSGYYKVKTYKISNGWAFKIVHDKKVFFNQTMIPVLPGNNPFPDKRSAKITGNIILERLKEHKVPLITIQDLYKAGIDTTMKK